MNSYTGREIAIFTDVHACLEPLISVINDIKKRNIKEVYSLGDNIGFGVNPKEVLDLIIDNNITMINGNAEDYVVMGLDPYTDYLYGERIDSANWTKSKLTEEQIDFLNSNKHSIDLIVGTNKIGLCHFANDVRFDYRERGTRAYQEAYKNNDNPNKQFLYTNSDEQIKKLEYYSKMKESIYDGYKSAYVNRLFNGKKVTYYDEIIEGHVHFKLYSDTSNISVRTLRAMAMGYSKEEKDDEAYYIILKEKDIGYDIEEVYVKYDRKSMMEKINNIDIPSKEKLIRYVSKGIV